MTYRGYRGSPWQQSGPNFGMNQMNPGIGNMSGYGGNPMGMRSMSMERMMLERGSGGGGGFGVGMNYGMSGGGMGMNQRMNMMEPVGRMGGGGNRMGMFGQGNRMNNRDKGGWGRNQGQRKRPAQQQGSGGGPRGKRQRSGGDNMQKNEKKVKKDGQEAYNPADPTEDSTDQMLSFQDEPETSGGGGSNDRRQKFQKHGGKGRRHRGGRGMMKRVGPHYCNHCDVLCPSIERFQSHVNSQNHKISVERSIMMEQQARAEAIARMEATEHLQMLEMRQRQRMPERNVFYCTVCECEYSGSFLGHRRTKEHRKNRDQKYPKCRLCRMTFNSPMEFKKHERTASHKKNLARWSAKKGIASTISDNDLDFVILDASGIFEDEDYEIEEAAKEEENEKAEKVCII
ncbi:zinc finger protein on ecdysone puffs-like isoform X2 [Limulus polyphemus]|uniref:Zinc finger protein on ecdysone puffs-like isoform X2 n=1 Tax=Limulus polyphemus TaxID=6850 RepID=A0ABM1SUF6_LIMPO|nr:zinc finger protein on ecdysone puffs-like isoform X2 [Limulus polyphemus]